MTDELRVARTRTKAHYELAPFVEGGPARVERWRQRLDDLLGPLDESVTLLDVGCGSGEVSAAARRLGAGVMSLDVTRWAADAAHGRGIPAIQADAMRMPFPVRAFDRSLAMGVLHHTPDARLAFDELLRVTSGAVVVLLYRRWTPYHFVYWAFAPVRARVPTTASGATPRWLVRGLRPLLRLATGLTYDDEQVRRIVADQLWTPTASFHGLAEVRRWAAGRRRNVDRVLSARGYSFTVVVGPERPI